MRGPGWFVLRETSSSASLWLQQEHGQLPNEAKQERRDPGAAVGLCTEAASAHFGNLMSKADRDPAGWLMELLAKTLMGLVPVQSPSC